ncbi:transcriptional regulator [Sesbania bispinosa]|nr:transcriptional regulator [Sesbania bispinosa]
MDSKNQKALAMRVAKKAATAKASQIRILTQELGTSSGPVMLDRDKGKEVNETRSPPVNMTEEEI